MSTTLPYVILPTLVLLYYAGICLFTSRETSLSVSFHVIPTITLLHSIYLASYRLKIHENKFVAIFNMTLSSYMLFAYLLHIFQINVCFLFIDRDGLNLTKTLVLSLIVLATTIAACAILEKLIERYHIANKTYCVLFKL